MAPELRRPRAVLLDLDGTLVDGSGYGDALVATCASIAAAGHVSSAEALLAANLEVWATRWVTAEAAWTSSRLSGAQLRDEVWRAALERCGCTAPEAAAFAAAAHFEATQRAHRLFDDVAAFLDALATVMPVGLITNGAEDDQRAKLAVLGLVGRFEPLIISGALRVAKPDPAIFEHALAALALEPGEVWHVGDSLASDVGGARAAGLGSVWLNRGGARRGAEDPVPDLEIGSLEELGAYLLGG
jgi:putative hydrolase of the HAD superfamily